MLNVVWIMFWFQSLCLLHLNHVLSLKNRIFHIKIVSFASFLVCIVKILFLCFNLVICLDLGHYNLFHAFSWSFARDFYCFSTFLGPGKPENCIFCLNASPGVCPATNSSQRSGIGAKRLSSSGVGPQMPLPQVALISLEWRWACTKWIWACLAWSRSWHVENSDEVGVLTLFGNLLGIFMYKID